MSDVWIFGADGQLGHALTELYGDRARAFTRRDLDLEDVEGLRSKLDPLPCPKLIFNATAYNHVDRAETERRACETMNVLVPEALAVYARDRMADFYHYSTDFVYSGEGDREWREADPAEPINHYGRCKLAGEQAVLDSNPLARVFRTSWVYSHRRHNFPLAILKKAHESTVLTVVDDQIGNPTYAVNLAWASAKIAEQKQTDYTAGIYHLSDVGHVSRFDFAREVVAMASREEFELAGVRFRGVKTATLESAAKRPLNTKLNLTKVQQTFGLTLPTWQEGLKAAIRRYYEAHR